MIGMNATSGLSARVKKWKYIALFIDHDEWTPTDLFIPVKIVNTPQQWLQQETEKLRQARLDLLKEGVIIPTISPCNSPIWPVFKADKNEWS